jgi:ATP-dependent Clp protease ATP-binding subunit ClpC
MIKYDKDIIKVLKLSEKEANKLKHPYVGTEHFILGILSVNNDLSTLLKSYGVTYNNYRKEIIKILKIKNKRTVMIYTPLLKKLLIDASVNGKVTLDGVFKTFLEKSEGIGITILTNLNIDLNKLYSSTIKKTTIGIGNNLNESAKCYNMCQVIGRDKEINSIIEILCRKTKNNPLLIGEAGVGKTAIVEALAYKIVNKEVPKSLYNKEIISINKSSIVSGTKYRGEFEEKLHNIIKEFENNDNLILFIDEIHTVVGAGGAEGAIDASNILKPYLARNKLKCIGATTTHEYNKSINKDKALNRRFHSILIKEPNYNETVEILKKIKRNYEKFHNVRINNKQIELIVSLSNKYLKDKKEPDKSIDILDEVCTKTELSNTLCEKDNLKLQELYKEKENSIKNKKFDKAIIIEKSILNEKKYNSNKNTVLNETIFSCFKKDSISNGLGFKYT